MGRVDRRHPGAAGLRTVLQAWDFRPGENFLRRMDEALAEADRVLAVLSPAYLWSEYARDEWTAALVHERGQPDRLLPVRVALASCRRCWPTASTLT